MARNSVRQQQAKKNKAKQQTQPQARSSPSVSPHPFTLSQEAQNSHRLSIWASSRRLRDSSITFVSGGTLHQEPNEKSGNDDTAHPKNVQNSSGEVSQKSPAEQGTEAWTSTATYQPKRHVDVLEASLTNEVQQIDRSAEHVNGSLSRRRASSTSSNSSADLLIFTGRGKPQKKSVAHQQPSLQLPDSLADTAVPQTSLPTTNDPSPAELSRPKPDAENTIPIPNQGTGKGVEEDGSTSKTREIKGKKARSKRRKPGKKSRRPSRTSNHHDDYNEDEHEDEINEEEVLQDYIENMKAEIGTENEDICERDNFYIHARKPGDANRSRQDDWSSDDLHDFDELGTSDEEVVDIGEVLSRRSRTSGLQYLVTPAGRSRDDAKWVRHATCTSTIAREIIQSFDEKHHTDNVGDRQDIDQDSESGWDSASDDDLEEDILNDVLQEQADEDDDNARLLQQTSTMSDEELARILSKQAELGYGTDDLMLFNGAWGNDSEAPEEALTRSLPVQGRGSKKSLKKNSNFPSAAAFADVLDQDPYGGFDIMDWERPSLRPRKKGRKPAPSLPFELEDEDLADQIAHSWANDRAKKAQRKAEREELRRAGPLGPKRAGTKPTLDKESDLDHHNGMNMQQVKTAVRMFLLDNNRESLPLAPMANGQRAQVHVLAKALRLKSVSHGKGADRFPVLEKTDFSGAYDECNISELDALFDQRRFSSAWGGNRRGGSNRDGPGVMSRYDKLKEGRSAGRRRGGGGGGPASAATYTDGDVVGASAPELGSDNKGRAMLEKMGWSSGMGIGKVGNQGSVEVIKHVVKNTKAGLG